MWLVQILAKNWLLLVFNISIYNYYLALVNFVSFFTVNFT